MIEKKFMTEAMKRLKIKEYLEKSLEKAGVVNVGIQRTTLATRIAIKALKPGLIIGRKGKNILELTESMERDLGIENPKIEVEEVRNPNLEPKLVVIRIIKALERGFKPKRIMKREAGKIIGSQAIGCEIILSGTWRKGGKARSIRLARGYIKKAGDAVKLVDKGMGEAILKQGKIGIKVNIVPPGVVFPDKVKIEKPEIEEVPIREIVEEKIIEEKKEEKPVEKKVEEKPVEKKVIKKEVKKKKTAKKTVKKVVKKKVVEKKPAVKKEVVKKDG